MPKPRALFPAPPAFFVSGLERSCESVSTPALSLLSLIDSFLELTQGEIEEAKRQDDGQGHRDDHHNDPLRKAHADHSPVRKVRVDMLHNDAVPEVYVDGMGPQVGKGPDPVVGGNEDKGPDQQEGQQVEACPVKGAIEYIDMVIALEDLSVGHLSGEEILQERELVREAVADIAPGPEKSQSKKSDPSVLLTQFRGPWLFQCPAHQIEGIEDHDPGQIEGIAHFQVIACKEAQNN